MLLDTHCHIHSKDYPLDAEEVLTEAKAAGVGGAVCIGTDLEDSRQAVSFAEERENVWAAVGIHAEYAGEVRLQDEIRGIRDLCKSDKVVAVGEIGLDYHYKPYDRTAQIRLFEEQLQLALGKKLPVVFHVREAFDDFWPILDNFSEIKGVLHSFSDNLVNMKEALRRELYVGINGLVTFTKNQEQLEAFHAIPLEQMLLETDAPYLTPVPYRGKINQPAYVREVARWVADKRGLPFNIVVDATTDNARKLFKLYESRKNSTGLD